MGFEQEVGWLMKLKTSTTIQNEGVKLVFSTFVYWLWKSRNDMIFRGKTISPAGLGHMIMTDVCKQICHAAWPW